MKSLNVLLALAWAANTAVANKCRPGSPSSSVTTYSSSSVTSSSASPSVSTQPIGVNLLYSDIDIVDNAFGRWTVTSSNPRSISIHTCGDNTPANDCIIFTSSTTESYYTALFSYAAYQTYAGYFYTFSFDAYAENTRATLPATVSCSVTNVTDPQSATLSYTIASIMDGHFNTQSMSFEALGETVITCSFAQTTPQYIRFGQTSFSLIRTA